MDIYEQPIQFKKRQFNLFDGRDIIAQAQSGTGKTDIFHKCITKY